MTHGKRPRRCHICGNKVSIGGQWKKCAMCGWTSKPKPPEEIKRRAKIEKLKSTAIFDRPDPPSKEEIAARKKQRLAQQKRRDHHFKNLRQRFKERYRLI